MRLTVATDYAMRMVLHLSELPFGSRITGAELAKAQKIPKRFLLKIMRELLAAHIIQSYRGVAGGFSLFRKPKDITLLDVVEAVEGPLFLKDCLIDAEKCTKQTGGVCALHQTFNVLQANLADSLRAVNFEMVVQREAQIIQQAGQRKNK